MNIYEGLEETENSRVRILLLYFKCQLLSRVDFPWKILSKSIW